MGSLHLDAETIKEAVRGHWPDTLRSLAPELVPALDAGPQRHVCCPLPHHDDKTPSFRIDRPDEGRAICSCGGYDPWKLLELLRKWTFPESLEHVAKHLGLNGYAKQANGQPTATAPIESLARVKRCPLTSLIRYGGKVKDKCVEFPVYGPDGAQCSTFTINPTATGKLLKGLLAKGHPAGLFLPHQDGAVRPPKPGETWHMVEGVKDAAALDGLGLQAVGLPGSKLSAKFVPVFTGVNVVIIPDRDQAGHEGAEITAARLHKVAASVRIATLPTEFKASGGDDVRDVLVKQDGEKLLRQAIETAVPWVPLGTKEPTADTNGIQWICTAKGITEAMNARRFAVRFHTIVRYCERWGKWLVWDGQRWAIDDRRAVDGLAKEVGQQLWAERAALAPKFNPDEDKAVLKMMTTFCVASNSDHGLRCLLALARSEPGIPITPSQLDRDPFLLTVENGTINLRTGECRPHSPDDYNTKLPPVEFREGADCPLWYKFLQIILPDADLRGFVRRLVGYCLTGATTEHVLPFLYGIGANGKSTFLNVLLALLGADYAMKAPTDLLLSKSNESHPTELADLFGKRFVACIEAEDGRRLAESLVKELTGGDRIRARRMREDFWEFQATHKIWLAANHKPTVRGTDHGIWRRIKLIPFTVVIPDQNQDKELPNKLLAELPGILNWALLGCLEWQRDGLGEPSAVKAATADYRNEMDVLGDFIAERCIIGDRMKAGATQLFDAYKAWCESTGERQLTMKRFAMQLEERGFRSERNTTTGRMDRHGIGLLDG